MRLLTLLTLLIAVPAGVRAERTIGAWIVEHDESEGYYAITMNDSGNLLGQFCFPERGSCVWFLGIDTACDEGGRIPVLANSDAGATSLTVLCDGQLESGPYRYAFTDFDAVDAIVREGQRVGFAFPLEGDRFSVERFNLSGSNRAIERMREQAEEDSGGRTGTKTEIM